MSATYKKYGSRRRKKPKKIGPTRMGRGTRGGTSWRSIVAKHSRLLFEARDKAARVMQHFFGTFVVKQKEEVALALKLSHEIMQTDSTAMSKIMMPKKIQPIVLAVGSHVCLTNNTSNVGVVVESSMFDVVAIVDPNSGRAHAGPPAPPSEVVMLPVQTTIYKVQTFDGRVMSLLPHQIIPIPSGVLAMSPIVSVNFDELTDTSKEAMNRAEKSIQLLKRNIVRRVNIVQSLSNELLNIWGANIPHERYLLSTFEKLTAQLTNNSNARSNAMKILVEDGYDLVA